MTVKRKKFLPFLSLPLCPRSPWLSSNWWCFEVHINHWFSHAPDGLCADWMDRALGRCWHKQTQRLDTCVRSNKIWKLKTDRLKFRRKIHTLCNKGVTFLCGRCGSVLSKYKKMESLTHISYHAYRKVKKDIGMARCMCATFCILKVTSTFNVVREQVCVQGRG